MTKVLGIDLGTSHSAAAVLSEGNIRIIPSFNGKTSTGKPFPSVVSFLETGEILVGIDAIEQSHYNPKGTIYNVKRNIGSREAFHVFGKEYSPEFIEALILTKIKLDAEYSLKEKVIKAVITVPAYFNDNQRQATKTAGEIAGLDVVRIMTEPVAAAISYGIGKLKEPTKVLVFDMGAGTLDVSILEIDNGFFEVIGTGGDTHLGGMDMDNELANYISSEYKKQNGSNLIIDEVLELQINRLSEKVKIELTEKEEVLIDEIFFSSDRQTTLNLKITRIEFEKLVEEPVLKKCEQCVHNVLDDLKMTADSIDKVVLVGGPTRIPAVRKLVTQILKEPEIGVDPEFSVAVGAAIEGAVLANDKDLPVLYQGLTLLNVTPLDLGEKSVIKSELGITLMIPKNTTYPTEITRKFYKKFPMNPKIEVSVWQGDLQNNYYDFHLNENLGSFWLYVPQREDLEIEVTYKIDANGILTVSAVETSTGNIDQLVIEKMGGSVMPKPELEYISKETNKFEEEYRKTTYDVLSPYEIPVRREESPNATKYKWMCTCLNEAKSIIRAYHGSEYREFLSRAKFELFIQQDKQYAFGHIQLGMDPYYPIGIHNALKEDTMDNRRMVTVVLIHELLHAIHPDWGHDRIRPAEHVLANKASLYDALVNMDRLFLSGKMSFCNNTMDVTDSSIRILCED
jgi:molecular chaperone DnaK